VEYLLAALGGGGVIGAVVLGVLLYRSGRGNRSDLHKLVQCVKDLADARRDLDAVKRRNEELQDALSRKEDELGRERDAAAVARDALSRNHEKLATSGDAAGVARDIGDALKRLSEMSEVPGSSPSSDGDG